MITTHDRVRAIPSHPPTRMSDHSSPVPLPSTPYTTGSDNTTGVNAANLSIDQEDEIIYEDHVVPSSPLATLIRVLMPLHKSLTLQYIREHQPWESDELPHQYWPDKARRWFPPLMCLGVAVDTDEMLRFCEHFNLWKPNPDREPTGEELSFAMFDLQFHLSKVCGLPRHRQITAMSPDAGSGLDTVYTLATNYDLRDGEDIQEPFDKLVDAVEEVFGDSKSVVWWLESDLNYDRKSRPVSGAPLDEKFSLLIIRSKVLVVAL